jgi:uncharacterized MAPEG superfamily protein
MCTTTSLLSLANSPWKLNIFLPAQLACTLAAVAALVKTKFSDILLSLAPVELEKVPYFCLLGLIAIWATVKIVVAFGVANSPHCKHAYRNDQPRTMNNIEYMGKVLYRLQCAHENTLEALAVATAVAVIGSNTDIEATIFAKLSMFTLVARVIYPFIYALGPDLIRSVVFSFGLCSSLWIAVYGLFPKLA